MTYRTSPALLAFAALLAASTAACGKGGGGDAPSEPVASVLGNGSRISDVFKAAAWYDPDNKDSYNCGSPADRNVHVTGVTIQAVDRFDEVSDGAFGNLYVQDTTQKPGEYEGMTVFDPSFSPPDLRVARGDVLDFAGVYEEFVGPNGSEFPFCETLPEIAGTGSFRFEGSDVPAKEVSLADLSDYDGARRYMGMLVMVSNVKISADANESNSSLPTGGRYTLALGPGAPTISNELFDLKNNAALAKDTEIKCLKGIVTYFYSFHIAPRDTGDLDFKNACPKM